MYIIENNITFDQNVAMGWDLQDIDPAGEINICPLNKKPYNREGNGSIAGDSYSHITILPQVNEEGELSDLSIIDVELKCGKYVIMLYNNETWIEKDN